MFLDVFKNTYKSRRFDRNNSNKSQRTGNQAGRSATQRIFYVDTLPRGQTSNPYLFQHLTSSISKREISSDLEKFTPLNNFPLSKILIYHREHIVPLSPTINQVGLPASFSFFPADFLPVVAWKNITLYIYLSSHPNLLKSYFCEHFPLNYDQPVYTMALDTI